ncbi:MAG: glycogen synthase [Spirochaetia bacterium]
MKQKKLKVLMVTSEAVPFAKSGGLADVVSSLSKELDTLRIDVRIVMPRYYFINAEHWKLQRLESPLGIPLGFHEEWCGVLEGKLPESDVPVYFLEHNAYFGRDGIYTPKSGGGDYPDNIDRFTLLSRGAFQVCKMLNWFPNVMHAHDWPSALVPVYLYSWEWYGEFADTAGVFTIHNIGYQGVFPKDTITTTQLTWEHFYGSGFEFYDQLNLMKAGIHNSDIITTVSPTYAQEIQSPEYGHQMDGLLRRRSQDLFGILNGIDYSVWDPSKDKSISVNFDSDSLEKKAKLKEDFQKELGLEVNAEKPLIGIVSRLADQKGFGELCGPGYGSLYSICNDMDIQFVILGLGESWVEKELQTLSDKLANLKVILDFNEHLAHSIIGASDFFLIPSRYEPCGLTQMYALRYGSLPIVRHTGGLADTVENLDESTGEGDGFVFKDLTPQAIYNTIGWAVHTWYNSRDLIEKMRKRGMARRFSWKKSAKEYADVYQWAIDRRKGDYYRTW